jgi:putative MATE family efflux protein
MTNPTSIASAPTIASARVVPRFVSGSIMRHVAVMASAGAIGLIAIFLVDLINLFYLSRLDNKSITAAVGFFSVIGFFQTSFCIGITIGIAAVVGRTVGAGRIEDARRIATSSLVFTALVSAVLGSGSSLLLGPMLDLLGAQGETRMFALQYLRISVHSLPFLAVGMASAALLRSVGDARRSMNVTLAGAAAVALFDPVLIFVLHLDLQGAAISTFISRIVLAGIGMHGVARRHHLLGKFERYRFAPDAGAICRIAAPSILTNLATPFGAAFVTHFMSPFGASAVSGQAMVERLSPVAFGLVYGLTGAVGPILSQNFGAGRLDRVRESVRASLLFMLGSVLAAWLVLALTQGLIIRAFSATGMAAELIGLFCTWLAPSFIFIGGLFVANATFNNLGTPLLSTAFSWGRATLGTVPFAFWGAHYGPGAILAGQAAGAVVFGSLAVLTAFAVARRLGSPIPATVSTAPGD